MATKKILCIGGSGQLGQAVTKCFLPYEITNIDFKECPSAKNNILIKTTATPSQNNRDVITNLKSFKGRFNSIVVTAGGWIGGSIKDEDYFSKCQSMLDMNLTPSLLGAHLATRYLDNNGLVVFTGAAAVFREPQP